MLERDGSASWLNITEAAAYLGVSTKTIRRWIHAGTVRAELRPGRTRPQYVVPLADLDARRPERRAASVEVVDLVHHHLARWDEALEAHLLEDERRLARVEQELQQLRVAVLRRDRDGNTPSRPAQTVIGEDELVRPPAPEGDRWPDDTLLAELRAGLATLQTQVAALASLPGERTAGSTAGLSSQVERLGALVEQLASSQLPRA
jgi:excisionase family DNA binding protein